MAKAVTISCIALGCLAFAAAVATAQEVIHALTGTVSSIDPTAKTISIYTDDHSQAVFKDLTNRETRVEFDKNVRANATAAVTFNRKGAYVIAYYFGEGNGRTIVGLRDLGAGSLTKSSGIVLKSEGKDHSLTIKQDSGVVSSFKITPGTVAETDTGVTEGLKFHPEKGDHVQVIATASNGGEAALFINGAFAP